MALTAWLITVNVFGQDASNASILSTIGASEAEIAKIETAVKVGREQNDWKPLEDLLDDDTAAIAMFSTVVLLENGCGDAVTHHLKKRGKHFSEVLLFGAIVPTLGWLEIAVAELSSEHATEDSRETARLALKSVSGEGFDDSKEWENWLADNRETFERSGVPEPDQDAFYELVRTRAAKLQNANLRETLIGGLNNFKKDEPPNEKVEAALESVGSIFDELLAAREAGASVHKSADGKAGDQFFRVSEFSRAAVAYRRAFASNPDDNRSRYLYGLSLFEAKRFDEAVTAFTELAERNPRADAAAFMAKVAGTKPIGERNVFEVAQGILKEERRDSEGDRAFSFSITGGWNCPVIKQIAGENMQQFDTITTVDRASLLETIAECSALADWRGVIGAAFCLPRDERLPHFLDATKMFETRPEVFAAALGVSATGLRRGELKPVRRELLTKFAAIDKDNLVAQLLYAMRDVEEEVPGEEALPPEPELLRELCELSSRNLEVRAYVTIHQRACNACLQGQQFPYRSTHQELPSLLSITNLKTFLRVVSKVKKTGELQHLECMDRLLSSLWESGELDTLIRPVMSSYRSEVRKTLAERYKANGKHSDAQKVVVPEVEKFDTTALEVMPLLMLFSPSIDRGVVAAWNKENDDAPK